MLLCHNLFGEIKDPHSCNAMPALNNWSFWTA